MQARRQQYLNAMGIQVWQRRETPSAASLESHELEIDAAEVALTTEPEQPIKHVDVAPIAAPVDDLETVQIPASEPTAQHKKASDTPEFRFASVLFPDACLIISEVALNVPEPVSSAHIAYLKSLLFALGLPANASPQLTFFNWPMLRGANFDQSSAAAQEASRAFMRAQMTRNPVPVSLVMGEQAGRYLLPEFVEFEQDRGRVKSSDEVSILLTEAIETVFEKPHLKARVWSDLQPLRGCLLDEHT